MAGGTQVDCVGQVAPRPRPSEQIQRVAADADGLQSLEERPPLLQTPWPAVPQREPSRPQPAIDAPPAPLTRLPRSRPHLAHAPKPRFPADAQSPEQARAACQAFSDDAARRGVDTLIIGFEGLLSYDASGTAAAYAWAAGERREPPRGAAASGYVLHGLVRPIVERFGSRVEFLVLPHEAEHGDPNGLPATCARIWQQHGPERRLVVAGHSMGGASASALARTLAQSGTPLDLMVTIDAVSTPRTPLQRWDSTARVFNFPRATRLPVFGTIAGADIEQRIPEWHINVPGHHAVVDTVANEVGALIAGRRPRS